MPQHPPSREGTLGANASGHPAARGTAKPPQGHHTSPLSACQMHVLHLRNLCLYLGFILNDEKYDLMPSQTFNFLGMNFNTTTMLVSPSPQRLQRLHEVLSGLYRQHLIPVRSLYSLLGTMESLSNLVPLGRSRKRPF
ncbi:hypothetical protein ACOMHN_046070 [Nucella lapillus]